MCHNLSCFRAPGIISTIATCTGSPRSIFITSCNGSHLLTCRSVRYISTLHI
nr:MAG TPA: hypothetical protein [Caudoviricetes sp.]